MSFAHCGGQLTPFNRRTRAHPTVRGLWGHWIAANGLPVVLFAQEALIRIVGTALAEQHDEWVEVPNYLGLDVLNRALHTVINSSHCHAISHTNSRLAAKHLVKTG